MLLSIGMIVKDEEKNLQNCLSGLKPILEQVESELIIVDTGSTDATIDIATAFTKKVYKIEWREDFALARNYTLERAKGEWYMFLDADEIFQEVSDIIKFFNSREYKKYRSASHLMVMKGDETRNVYTRLFKKEQGTRFQGRIHEQIPLQPPVKNLNSWSLHTGYFFDGEEGKARKAAKHERNMKPLIEMHKENPKDMRVIALIVNELMSADELSEARRFIDTGLNTRESSSTDVFYNFLLYANLVWDVKSKEFEKAAAEAENHFKTTKKLFVSAVYMRIAQAFALEKREMHDESIQVYKEALNLISAYKTGKLDDEDVRMNVTKPPSKETEKTAAEGIARNYSALGDFEASYDWIKKYHLETAEMLGCVREGERAGELENFVRACYKYLPKKDPGALSKRDRFVYYANSAYENKARGDTHKFVSGMREALKEDPSMGPAVQSALEGLKNAREDTASAPPAQRLNQETEALKNAIMGLIIKGKLKAAGEILEKYVKVNPKDPDNKVILNIIARTLKNPSLIGELELMQKVETVFVLSNIIIGGTGVINSVLRKVKLMEDTWGVKPLILTCKHNIELRRIRQALGGLGGKKIGLGKNARVLNVYDYFQKTYAQGLANKAVYFDNKFADYRKTDDEAVYEVLEKGNVVRREFFTGYEGALRAVMFVEEGRNKRFEFYDDWGYLNKVCHFDPSDGSKIIYTEFYSTDGFVRVKNIRDKLIVYDEDGGVIRECESDDALAALCLEHIIADDKLYMLVAEDGLMGEEIGRLRQKNIVKTIVVHSIFQEDPYAATITPNIHYKYLCENPGEFDAIVFTTEEVKEDFIRSYGRDENKFVIPHPYPYPVNRADFDKRRHKKAVIVTRFDKVKQIDIAIDIFNAVVKKVKDAQLEIYGFGPLRHEYMEQIHHLGLENNVFLMGVTDDPGLVFSGAALSMMTSVAEGFPLSLVESICNGCPVFAFDIKYGPSDIIAEGKTGFLIPRFDKTTYADRLISYFDDVEAQRNMSESCYEDAARFGSEKFAEKWLEMTERICNI